MQRQCLGWRLQRARNAFIVDCLGARSCLCGREGEIADGQPLEMSQLAVLIVWSIEFGYAADAHTYGWSHGLSRGGTGSLFFFVTASSPAMVPRLGSV
jgi:hypothetical protein